MLEPPKKWGSMRVFTPLHDVSVCPGWVGEIHRDFLRNFFQRKCLLSQFESLTGAIFQLNVSESLKLTTSFES